MNFIHPPRPSPGDRVAIVSPSSQLAARYPMPLELGLSRLRDELGLLAVEYPTTRAERATPAERARDLHTAFADPEIAAVFATIGGEDELRVLAHLDQELIAGHPKPFFGYSDNTNLHLFLWRLGIVSYHGCAVMVQLGRPGRIHPLTLASLRAALFERGEYQLTAAAEYEDEERPWDDPATFDAEPASFAAEGWSWHGPQTRISGPAWGGSLEIVDFHLRAHRYLPDDSQLDGAVLFLETSEELPDASYVGRVLMCMGERGLLARFAAVLWGRPKAWSFERRHSAEQKRAYYESQRAAVVAALAEYAPALPLAFGVEFGHTEPQHMIPSGGTVTVDTRLRQVTVTY